MTRFIGLVSWLGLAGGVIAAPPTPGTAGVAGAVVSVAPGKGLERATGSWARPRAGAFVTSLYPDARTAITTQPVPQAELKIDDRQDMVVLAPHRPIRIRITVLFEGKPVTEMWHSRLRKMFAHFDRDGDGALNGFEVQNIFSDTGMVRMLQNGVYQPVPQDRPSLERLDLDGDRKVSPGEMLQYYKTATRQMLQSQQAQTENPYNASTTEAIYKLIDANGDSRITGDEVRALEKLVASLDTDEDECLSISELLASVPNSANGRQPGVVVPVQRGGNPATRVPQTVFSYLPGRIPGTLTQQVITRYDRDGDFDLTREECAFDVGTFTRLDADRNGKLDGEELDLWRTGPPDLEVSMSLAPKAVDCVVTLVTDGKEASTRGFEARPIESGRLIIRAGRQPIEFWAYAAVISYRQQSLKTSYQYLFQQASGGKNHILEKELSGPNTVQYQFLRTVFDACDADGDGRLTRAEFDEYFDLQDEFRNIALAVTPAVQTPTLFQLLDENRDGRLGVRELRTSWDRLIGLEPPGATVITREAIQPSLSIRLTRGMDRYYINQMAQPNYNGQNQVAVPQKGPAWFRKMDHNADGDVSRSEFLGTRSEFNLIDGDRDNLISLEEAEAYDRKMREKSTPAGLPDKK